VDEVIGVFVNNREGYQGCIVREAEEEARRQGLTCEIHDAEFNASRQTLDLVRFAGQHAEMRRCAALVVPENDTISGDGIDPVLHTATRVLQKGVGFVTLNHGRPELVSALRAQFPTLPIALIGIDNREFGRVQGRQLQRLMPESGGTVLYIRGNPGDSACQERADGLTEELQHPGRIEIEEITARWSGELAEEYVQKWITSPMRRQLRMQTLQLVVAQNDHMGAGARRALRRAGDELGRPELRTIPVIGGDGLPDFGQRWVTEGALTATVSVTLPGRPAVQQIAQHWRSGAPLPAVTRLPVRSYPDLTALRPAGA
jgi:ABC-type sugar transport system substrate-binding protein